MFEHRDTERFYEILINSRLEYNIIKFRKFFGVNIERFLLSFVKNEMTLS